MKKLRLKNILKLLNQLKRKNKMGGIKIPNFYASPLHETKTISVGENMGYIKKDKEGNEFTLVDENSIAANKGDTIRPADNKMFKKGVIGEAQGSIVDLEGNNFLMGGDYNVEETGDKTLKIISE